jgi:hypothetical protein
MTTLIDIEPISRQWVKDTSNPAIVLIAKGGEYLTLLAALRWASKCGPGPERRRHGGYAYERLVADLPAARPETILHRKELLALIDGLEHFAVLDDETGANARALLHSVRTTVQMHGEARGR